VCITDCSKAGHGRTVMASVNCALHTSTMANNTLPWPCTHTQITMQQQIEQLSTYPSCTVSNISVSLQGFI
jgi:hypothetical protein